MEALLRQHPMLGCIGIEDWRAVTGGAAPADVPTGAVVYRQGDPADRLVVIARGAVVLNGADLPGPFGAGEVIGAESLVAGSVFAGTARASAPSTLLAIESQRLVRHLEHHFDQVLDMIGGVSASLRVRVREVSVLKLQSAVERLADFLAELAPGQGGAVRLRLPFEKQILAERLGMDPATLSRAFGKLRALGVDTDRQDHAVVLIQDIGRLRGYAEDPEDGG